jgi:hypothetical protein
MQATSSDADDETPAPSFSPAEPIMMVMDFVCGEIVTL